ncbi:hypothetical protein L6164_002197 [Bauhinia variegata]|uniref:Uncharacterized protein n=1 Tax=Bauhinia variegata TaxID=167791 RepID=A0ACB9PWW7_BAUVA|nr:hypothetical protein L6164_002197 [Bauhinia variegata]
MENLSYISLRGTAIKEIPCSIQNVIGLSFLDLSFCQRLKKVPTCILVLPKLKKLHVGEGSSLKKLGLPPKIKLLSASNCTSLLPSVLDLITEDLILQSHSRTEFILPGQMIPKWYDRYGSRELQNIRVIQPTIKYLSTSSFKVLMSPALNLLINQFLYFCGNSKGNEQYRNEMSLSFWFRNEFPDISLFVVGGPNKIFDTLLIKCSVSINDHVQQRWYSRYPKSETEHTFLYILPCQHERMYSEGEWNHAEISCEFKELWTGKMPLLQHMGIYIRNQPGTIRIEKHVVRNERFYAV